jgi:CHAT domain-containing protein/Tfp pilus assembly protein PilF
MRNQSDRVTQILMCMTLLVAGPALVGSSRQNAVASVRQSPLVPQSLPELKLGQPVDHDLKGGETQSYRVDLEAGQFMQVLVDQRAIDVVVALTGPDGKTIAEMDSPNDDWGPERVSLVAHISGAYQVAVRSGDRAALPGHYQATLVELRATVPGDAARLSAERAFKQAAALHKQGTNNALAKAIDLYGQAAILYRSAHDGDGEGSALYYTGQAYRSMGQNQKALEYYNQCLPLQRVAGDRAGEATTLSDIGLAYSVLGERQKALDYFEQALVLARAVGERVGKALNNVGGAYDYLGDRRKALEYYNQALPEERAASDRTTEVATLNNIGTLHSSLGEKRDALDYYNQALLLERAMDYQTGERRTLASIGTVYSSLGEKQKALDYLNQALQLERGAGDQVWEANTLTGIGLAFDELGERQEALGYYNQALTVERALGDRAREATTLSNIGLVYAESGETQQALDYYNQALPLHRATGDRVGEASTLSNLGVAYDHLRDTQKALDYDNQSLAIRRAVGDRAGEAATLSNIGAAYDHLGERQQALDYYNQALSVERAVENRAGEAQTLNAKAQAESEGELLLEARADSEAALRIVESLRTKVATQELRSSYFSTVQNYYELYISILMRMSGRDSESRDESVAFEANERRRARGLLDSLAESHADIERGVDPDLLKRERALQELIDGKSQVRQRLLSTSRPNVQAADTLKSEIETLLDEYRELETQIRAHSPHYAALTQPEPLTVGEIQHLLDPKTVLLAYSLGTDCSYLWAVTAGSLRSYTLPKQDEIESLARRVYDLLTVRGREVKGETEEQRLKRLDEARRGYPSVAAKLSAMVLGPAASQLGGKRLVIVADGALEYIPFGVLPTPGAALDERKGDARASVSDKRGRPLIADHEIMNLPSASVLAELRQESPGRRQATKLVAVLADPVFDAGDPRVKGTVTGGSRVGGPVKAQRGSAGEDKTEALSNSLEEDRLTRSANEVGLANGSDVRFPRLLFTRQEANSIYKEAPAGEGMEALDFRATRELATSAEMAEYRIIHFATHGLLDSEHPELSGLVLSMVDEDGRPKNGFLGLQDTFNLKLAADLVVLSACETALGKDVKGEGLEGLTRGFMYAGARQVVASLWRVDDVATAELMEGFYEKMLKEGLKPAAALRQAQIAMWRQTRYSEPYFWAGFVVQGNW